MDTSAQCRSSRNSTSGRTREISASSARQLALHPLLRRALHVVTDLLGRGALGRERRDLDVPVGAIVPHHPANESAALRDEAGCRAPRAPADRLQCRRAAPSTCPRSTTGRCGPASISRQEVLDQRSSCPCLARRRPPRRLPRSRRTASNASRRLRRSALAAHRAPLGDDGGHGWRAHGDGRQARRARARSPPPPAAARILGEHAQEQSVERPEAAPRSCRDGAQRMRSDDRMHAPRARSPAKTAAAPSRARRAPRRTRTCRTAVSTGCPCACSGDM